ncbi:MAG: aspartyl/glutamyl-tRNA amidotransferase subunit A [Desulfobacteraceae bacterium 4572_19]|nr:MAG: aspartyl/glutamyl-tRNA amidotransferase subunit A [Desulfobacteraceae bacterium 4572_19]
MKLHQLTIEEASGLLIKKEISSNELVKDVIEQIYKMDDKIGAYLNICSVKALEQAKNADKRFASGKNISPLTGIPISIKDLINTEGIETTCASKILKGYIPPYDATVIKKLKDAGAVIVGKVNMDEFAMGSSNENSGIKITRNPWDLDHIPGGSSGGSAASVAANMCLGSLGSDTGGSIRQPASHCGVVGLKPTYGRVSRFGIVAFASSLDQVGPLTKNVTDCSLLYNTIAGYDPNDSTSADQTLPDLSSVLIKNEDLPLKGMTIGIPVEYIQIKGIDPDVTSVTKSAIKIMENLGANCIEISLPRTEYVVAAYYLIATSEASSNLARYDGVKYGLRDFGTTDLYEMYKNTKSNGFGKEVQRRIILGTYALSSGYYDAYYKKASQARTLIMEDFKNAFTKCDIILSPVAPAPAQKIGEFAKDPLVMYLSDIFTISANLAGIPGISVPAGQSSTKLPIGLQLMGKHFDEKSLFKAAYCFEQAVHFNKL